MIKDFDFPKFSAVASLSLFQLSYLSSWLANRGIHYSCCLHVGGTFPEKKKRFQNVFHQISSNARPELVINIYIIRKSVIYTSQTLCYSAFGKDL